MSANISLFEKYCVDSSFLLEFWDLDSSYCKGIKFNEFVWNELETSMSRGEVVSSIEIYKEIKDDVKEDFSKWVKNNKGIFLPLDLGQIAVVSEIVNKYPDYTKGGKKQSAGDPFLVALAKNKKLTVLTNEKYAKAGQQGSTPKLPNLCDEFGVKCMNIYDYIKAEINEKIEIVSK